MTNNFDITTIKFDAQGLVPAVAQDAETGEVLMLAYMNRESLTLTLETGYATYFSRSRKSLWKKGATSGHLQRIIGIAYDCDGDAILLTVEQTGAACHTGERSCFHNQIIKPEDADKTPDASILRTIYDTIADRDANPKEGSYTNYLLTKGVEKICKKVGEESAETIIASVKGAKDEVQYEAADLIYHLLVLLYNQGLTPEDIYKELAKRHK
jgi:phosphoribosyl-ATP pyrophosphohydrolase/phosphoribosyl-AMP cyclohydrolase